MQSAISWAASHGVALRNAALAQVAHGFGVVATGPIAAGDLVLRVPHSLMLAGDDTSNIGQTNALAIALLQERTKGAASGYGPYLDVLPRQFNTPMFFNATERAGLRGTDVLEWSQARESNVVRTHAFLGDTYWHVASAVDAKAGGTSAVSSAADLDDFKWALSIAWSRGFALSMRTVANGESRRPCLVPVGDAFNHAEVAGGANMVTHSYPEQGVFDFVATKSIAPGQEALLSYSLHGEPSNGKLLLDYGFCMAYSLHDEVSVALMTADEVDVDPRRASLLRALQLEKHARAARLTIDGPDPASPPPELIAVGRILTLDGPQLDAASPQSVLGPQEPAFEAAVLRLLAARLEARLAQYGEPEHAASHEDDEHQLARGGWRRSSGADCALHVRAGERRILLHWWRRLHALATPDQPLSRWAGGGRQHGPDAHVDGTRSPMQTFQADAVGWEPHADVPLPAAPARATLEVHAHDAPALDGEQQREVEDGIARRHLRGVLVARGSRLRLGDLAGCYTGALLGPDERTAKRGTGFEAYSFPVNATHVVDPTDARGHVRSETRHQMALVNEPTGSEMPNLTPMDYRYGLCRDRDGEPGVPYYAVREILPGEALTVCYGPGFARSYSTACADRTLLGRWTELQARLLRPLLQLSVAQ